MIEQDTNQENEIDLATSSRQEISANNEQQPIQILENASHLTQQETMNRERLENEIAYYSKWRYFDTYPYLKESGVRVINVTPAMWVKAIGGYNISIGKVPFDHLDDGQNDYYLAAGVAMDLDFKFSVVSNIQVQGALIFAYAPFNIEKWSQYLHKNQGADAFTLTDAKAFIQLEHTILNLGTETEVIVTVPYVGAFETIGFEHRDLDIGSIGLGMLEELTWVGAASAKLYVRAEVRARNVRVTGRYFDGSIKAMGNHGTYK